MLQTIAFTTDDLGGYSATQRTRRVNDRLDKVVGGLCEMYASGEPGTAGRMRLSASPDIVIGVLSGLPVTCERTASHITTVDDDALFVQLNLGTAPIHGRQLGRDYTLAPGDAAICVHNASLRFDVIEGATLLGITLPRRWTETWGLTPEDLAGRSVVADTSPLRFLAPYAKLLCDQPLNDPGFAGVSAAHLAYLIGAGFGGIGTADEIHAGIAGETRLGLLRRIIRRDWRSDALTAASAGAELGISERMVQHLLHEAGTTFSQALGDYRAERARVLLRDPAFDGRSVANIGFQCGFTDVSAFYRAFRRRFDASPGDIRACR